VRIETERLVIRPWRIDEAPRKFDILSRVEIVRWLDDGPPKLLASVEEAEAKIAKHHQIEPPLGSWAIEVVETGIPAGSVMLDEIPDSADDDGRPLVQIGWNLHPDSHGHGYATEAARVVLEYGHAHGLGEIRALMNLDNYPSIAVARRIPMRYVGVTHDWYPEPSEVFISP
jgi:RimJ/RimL family protein N-acetyltransferase